MWGEPGEEARRQLPGLRLLTFEQLLELGVSCPGWCGVLWWGGVMVVCGWGRGERGLA